MEDSGENIKMFRKGGQSLLTHHEPHSKQLAVHPTFSATLEGNQLVAPF